MADTAQNTQGAINAEVIDNAQQQAQTQATASGTTGFVMTEDNAWAILMRNQVADEPATYEAQIATVTTKDAKGYALIDPVTKAQYGIVNLRLQTPEQQLDSQAFMEAGEFDKATNNTLNFRITPNEFDKFTRGAIAIASVGMVDSIRQGREVLAITALRPQEAKKAKVGLFANRKEAVLQAKREAYLAKQAELEEQNANNIANSAENANTDSNPATPPVVETPAQEQA